MFLVTTQTNVFSLNRIFEIRQNTANSSGIRSHSSLETNKSFSPNEFKKDMTKNLHELVKFIRSEIDDQFEKQLYFEKIKTVFDYLSTI